MYFLLVTGKFSDAVKLLTAEIGMWRIVGVTFLVPAYLSFLATAYMGLINQPCVALHSRGDDDNRRN